MKRRNTALVEEELGCVFSRRTLGEMGGGEIRIRRENAPHGAYVAADHGAEQT
jgi:hypothetical protein